MVLLFRQRDRLREMKSENAPVAAGELGVRKWKPKALLKGDLR